LIPLWFCSVVLLICFVYIHFRALFRLKWLMIMYFIAGIFPVWHGNSIYNAFLAPTDSNDGFSKLTHILNILHRLVFDCFDRKRDDVKFPVGHNYVRLIAHLLYKPWLIYVSCWGNVWTATCGTMCEELKIVWQLCRTEILKYHIIIYVVVFLVLILCNVERVHQRLEIPSSSTFRVSSRFLQNFGYYLQDCTVPKHRRTPHKFIPPESFKSHVFGENFSSVLSL
jgi:hypothetical protein